MAGQLYILSYGACVGGKVLLDAKVHGMCSLGKCNVASGAKLASTCAKAAECKLAKMRYMWE